jgi:hypothetical protein
MEVFPFKLKVATRAFIFSEKSWTLKYFFSPSSQVLCLLSLLYFTVEGGWFGFYEFFEFSTFGKLLFLLFPSRIGIGSAARRAL